jgi:intracellular multiplication protein IcmG
MADDQKNPDDYQYPPEEYYKKSEALPEDMEPLEGEPPQQRRFASRRLLLALGFLIAIGLVYWLLSFFAAQQAPEVQPAQPVVRATPPVRPIAQSVAAPVIAAPAPVPDSTVQNLVAQNQQNQQTIAGLQAQVQQLQGQLTTLTSTITSLANQVQVIANEMRANALDRAVQGRALNLNSNAKIYHLKALVPGRAWLQSPEGQTTTVSIGDRLPGYGIIQMINTEQGIVTTSSGALIQYGPKDS